jgi:vancomycin resistance protein YoaR
MSTPSTELAQPIPGIRLPFRTFAIAFGITVGSILVFALVFTLALIGFNNGKIVPGTVVGNVPLGGLDVRAAEARLREQLPSLAAGHISVSFGDVDSRIEYADIGRDYDIAGMLNQAYAIGREGDIFSQALQQLRVSMNGATVQPRVQWNEQALEEELNSLAMAAAKAPIDASIQREGALFVVKPSAVGTRIDVQSAWQQALATVGTLSPADVTVRVEPTIDDPVVTTEMAQLAVDRVERVAGVDLTLSGDGLTQTISSDAIRGWIRLEPAGAGAWTLVVERDPLDQTVAQMSASIYKAPVDASFKFTGGNAVAVPGSAGRQLNVQATSDAVYAALVGRADGPPMSTVQLSIASIDPNFTTAQAIALAPKVKNISGWTTGFTPSERNYFGANIVLPAQKINGTVVPAGAKFSFWDTVGSLLDLEGIGPGGVIIRGHTNPTGALGGGICSCSTTLWNAAMRAGLEMANRANHDYYINRYPTGLDATVWRSGSSVQNMSFVNDTQYPIIIRGYRGSTKSECIGLKAEFGSVGYSDCVIFEIWSVPNGRTTTYSKAEITNIKVATDMMQYADEDPNGEPLAPGALLRIEYPTDGFWSTVVRTVRDSNGTVIHQDTIFSKYVRVTGMTLVGRLPTDPPAGTKFPNPNPYPNFLPPEAGPEPEPV